MPPKVNLRTTVLGGLALLLGGATVYDYTVGIGKEPASSPAAEHPAEAPGSRPDKVAALSREVSELKYFLSHAQQVRARYQAIAVPYAESVATFATLYSAGESPVAVAKKRVAGLLPSTVKIGDVLVSEAAPTDRGALWLTATLDFSSNDSEAFEKALLSLGNATNGMTWKELAVASDPERRALHASGKLALLMVEQVE